jgi:hypothetical protein
MLDNNRKSMSKKENSFLFHFFLRKGNDWDLYRIFKARVVNTLLEMKRVNNLIEIF